jgi:hypothetical protein
MRFRRRRRSTALDELIPAEIVDDPLAEIIETIAATDGVREILEIGSSTGDGSTAAWVRGARRSPVPPRLHCLEVSAARHAALVERWGDEGFVHCHRVSSIPLDRFPSADEIEEFYRSEPTRLRSFPLETVLGWLQQDLDYLREHDLSTDGIAQIKRRYGIDTFDAVLIDGSEFAGPAELEEVYGARFVLLDDTETYKNWHNVRRLEVDPRYRVVLRDADLRNGYAVFESVS